MGVTSGISIRRFSALRFVVAVSAAVSLTACRDKGAPDTQTASAAVRQDTAHIERDTIVSTGEVSIDSSAVMPAGRWITDANVLSLLSVMNSRQMAAADAELSAWHSDTVRAFASTIAREHAELQHSVDSIAARIHLEPVAPALAAQLSARMQSQIDSMTTFRNGSLDRAFVREQVASHELMADQIEKLAGVAQSADLQAMLSSAASRVGAQLVRAKSLQTTLKAADSLAAVDSAAKRAARSKRSGG